MSDAISRKTYLTQNVGDFAQEVEIFGRKYVKVEDLRYGTNPHQPAAYYKPTGLPCAIGDMEIIKSGKNGLSQTNLEDISYALNICKFFDRPCCACMKHVNPCGVAVGLFGESTKDVYVKARRGDPRAAFGCVAGFNTTVDGATAREIMDSFVECVVAPDFTDEALAVFNDHETYKINRHIRIIRCGDLTKLPRYTGDETAHALTFKALADGSVVVSQPLLTSLRSVNDLQPARATDKKLGECVSQFNAPPQQLEDLLTAWYINLNVRSNGVVIVNNGCALAVGTGEQDRVGAVEQAIWKCREKYAGNETLNGAVMASDGFFPFPDAVELAAKSGITAIIAPAGSLKDAVVIQRANELEVALYHAPERIFSHH